MDLLAVVILVIAAVVLLSMLLGVALVSAAKGADEQDQETGVLVKLAGVRSPSGRPFFGNPESVQDFVRTLDDALPRER
jgi:hypothetical protein